MQPQPRPEKRSPEFSNRCSFYPNSKIMAEPYRDATPTEAAIQPESSLPSASGTKLACYCCKRRKIKCDRLTPTCANCQKIGLGCEYPTHPEKPGPKTGSSSAQGTKRRRIDDSQTQAPRNSIGHGSIDLLVSAAGQVAGASFDLARRTSVLSPSSCHSPNRHDDARSQGDVASPQPGQPSVAAPTSNHGATAPLFSRIMYPSHEAQTRPQSPSTVDAVSPENQDATARITVESVCNALRISRNTYDMLMEAYFANMTAFSLFRPGSIEPKFSLMQHHSDAEALIAALFAFSAKHCREREGCPGPVHFAQIASSKLDESVDNYGDMPPPFWLLQAGILVTFYQLTLSVRSRSWKKLGDCIRYAYDTNLHLVDANYDPNLATDKSKIDMQRWVLQEERRRAWWAVWEMDVFASTIRRLPTAIDAGLNLTMLPVSDSCWFNEIYQESCFLAEDCSLRWKYLERSGNQSAKAWFIVINSLMRNTQRIVYPAGSAMKLMVETNHDDELNIMANCLYCTVTSLPPSLSYQGETFDFRLVPTGRGQPYQSNPRQEHADKYSIHLMTQLCRFMIYHHKICARAPWLNKSPSEDAGGPQANSEWSNYMNASDEIVTVVRNSSRDHYRFVNPFLANTLWFAAAAQCACKVFGPSSFNKRLTSSNIDLLKLTIDRFISFWGGMENLKGKLSRIETGLQNLMDRPSGNCSDGQGSTSETERPQRRPQAAIQRRIDNVSQTPNGNPEIAHPGNMVPLPPQINGAVNTMHMPVVMHGGVPAHHTPHLNHGGWPSFVPDPHHQHHPFDFAHPPQFAMAGGGQQQSFYVPNDPMDFSPFGLEELLMASIMDSQI
ncbi:putative fungal-specific transcription factor [Podospora australis]|uniref:Fungal-specific transcription factor n=1 Tax=Podospora australis TaxID=1536484 RepID=A0AAN7ADU0_9PEZI|nr:putative fungal-specific transcription factor [Podospora australis]